MNSLLKYKPARRRCTVRGCTTTVPHINDQKEKNENGFRQITLFGPPMKSPALLKQWSKILNQELTAKDKVCELHFAEKDIIKTNCTRLPDGTIFSLPRERYSLIKAAVPLNPNNQENKAPKNKVTASESISKNMTNLETNSENASNDISDNPNLLNQTDKERITNISDHSKDGFLNDHQYFINARKSDTYVYYNKEVATCFLIPKLKDVLLKKKEETTLTDNQISINDQVMDIEQHDVREVVNSKLTIQEIQDYLLKNPLPRTWTWMNCTNRDNGITFTQIDCKSRQIRCYVEIYEDLSIMLQTNDGQVSLEIEFQLTSVESISRMLQTVVRVKMCSGTSLEKERRDKDCTGIIVPLEEYKVQRSLERCVACRKLRLKIMHIQERDVKDQIAVKYEALKRENLSLKRRSKKLQENLDLKNLKLKGLTEMIKSVNKYSKNYQPES